MLDGHRQVTFNFLNGNSLSVEFPKQAGGDTITAMANVRKTLDADRILLEVDGDLLVIPWATLTHVRIHPAPETLPPGIIRGARVIGEAKNELSTAVD